MPQPGGMTPASSSSQAAWDPLPGARVPAPAQQEPPAPRVSLPQPFPIAVQVTSKDSKPTEPGAGKPRLIQHPQQRLSHGSSLWDLSSPAATHRLHTAQRDGASSSPLPSSSSDT